MAAIGEELDLKIQNNLKHKHTKNLDDGTWFTLNWIEFSLKGWKEVKLNLLLKREEDKKSNFATMDQHFGDTLHNIHQF